MLGIRTRGGKMVGADESTEPRQYPKQVDFLPQWASQSAKVPFLKWAISGPFFSIFVYSIQVTVDNKQMFNKSCRWLDSNPGPLILQATALPTVPQPLPIKFLFAFEVSKLVASL